MLPENSQLIEAVALLNSGDQPEFTSFVDKVTAYCIKMENGKVFDDWNEETIRQLVAYHFIKKTLIVLSNESAEIQGVLMWYNCDNDYEWSFVQEWKPDNRDGDSVFMAFLFASSTAAFRKITLDLIDKEPDVIHKKLIGCRTRAGRSHRVDYEQKFLSRLLKLKD
jgi:hypothetical protein